MKKLPLSTWLLLPALLLAEDKLEQPVGLVTAVDGGKLLRADTEVPLTVRVGDVLYAGDGLKGSVTFLYCPEKSSQTLEPGGELVLEARRLRLKSGRLAGVKTVEHCLLPMLERTPVASQLHYGRSLAAALETPEEVAAAARSRIESLPEDRRRALEAELAPIDKALAANSRDLAARVARAAVFEKYDLSPDALAEYQKILEAWPDALWVRSRILVHERRRERPQARTVAALRGGKTYALLIGISKYQRLPEHQWLRYAHEDALLFEKYLRSSRGGSLPDQDLVLLIEEKATTAAIKNAFETFLKARATKNDTVVVMIAAHGVVEQGRGGAYIITHDSDPEDLAATAIPMADIQNLIREDLAGVGQVLVFVDVCRAGTIGAMKGANTVNKVVERLAEVEGELFLFLASGPKELSFEGVQYGGGHGAFSYFLLDALNGGGDGDGDGSINVGETTDYVREKVVEGTRGRQHPRDLGSMDHAITLAEMKRPGITLARFDPARSKALLAAGAGGTRGVDGGPSVSSRGLDGAGSTREMDQALAAGRLLPGPGSDNGFAALRILRKRLTPEQYLIQENRLRVALEDAGQQVLLRYLQGEQTPQTREDFIRGAAYFEAAQLLTPESLLLEARLAFCMGRARLFEKNFRRAVDFLERAVRLDPGGAYSYNALGIAYLEQADYGSAIAGFRDAIRRAPYWAYPRHNLALAYTQVGDYDSAIRSYRQATNLAPQYSYLAYNLGLVYQALNLRRDAEAAFRRAIALDPKSAAPYNALGYLQASYGRSAEAERLYKEALSREPGMLETTQNLAVLLAQNPDRLAEALDLWRKNLAATPEYLPSRLSLARALARAGRDSEALSQYALIVEAKPDYVAARVALAELHEKAGNPEAALEQLREASSRQPDNPAIHEQIGDIESRRGRAAEAALAWRAAFEYAPDPGARKRLRKKLEGR